MPITAGDQLGAYRILSPLGAGGMGEVYRASDTRLGREVALKLLPADMAGDVDRLARFQREARAAAALNHPNVVTLYSVEQVEGIHFLTMELVDGRSLQEIITPDGMAAGRVVDLAAAMADAIAAAHDKDLVHRDLKPANIMITTDGRVKLLDFGLAKVVRPVDPDEATRADVDQTQYGVVMGTPPYMSPEQISGAAVDHRTDIFALGTILYEMLTGARPFRGTTQMQLAASILRDPMPAIGKPGVPGELSDLIERCLAKNPDERLSSARLLAKGLQSIKSGSSPLSTGRAPEGFWVAVASFKSTGASTEVAALAEGLTEEIIAGLSRFSYLRVLTKGTAGARYVLEGSLRQAGSQLRVAVQLKEATTGANLWAENYTRQYSPDRIFEIQDDLVPTIVSTVGETNGFLTHSMWTSLRDRDPATLTPYEAMLRCFGALEIQSPEELTLAATALERAIQVEPNHSGCLAMLSVVHAHGFGMGFNTASEPREASLACARRAVTAEPSNHLAHHALAMAQFFRKEVPAFRGAAARALALNPMDSYTLASLGMRTAYLGDWETGCDMVNRAMKLNPRHPGWYWFALTSNAYRQGDFAGALSYAVRVNLPTVANSVAPLAAIHGQLGNEKEARQAVKELLALAPGFASDCRERFARYFNEPALLDLWVEGWRKAGLFDAEAASGSQAGARTGSGAQRADEGFWVAVAPFRSDSGGAGLAGLASGLTEEVIAGLSRFSYLRVLTKGTAGARYVLEGSLRQAGSQVRATVKLLDTSTGANLWAENYTRSYSPDAVFEIQDSLAPTIVSTIAETSGVLAHSMWIALRDRDPETLTPYEAMLRSFGYLEHLTPDEHRLAMASLKRAIEQQPNNAGCLAVLAIVCADGHLLLGFGTEEKQADRGVSYARRAVAAEPSDHFAHYALAWAHASRKDVPAFRSAAERSLALNPLDGGAMAGIALWTAYNGEWQRGCELMEHAMALNPRHAGWYWYPRVHDAYRQKDYSKALDYALRVNLPGQFWTHLVLAMVQGQLGNRDAAADALRELLAIYPDFSEHAKAELEKWFFESAHTEHVLEGLRKAGLKIHGDPQRASRQADEGFWVAVLPFKAPGSLDEVVALADGLSEGIVTGLSRFSYLRVIGRGSTLRYASQPTDLRAVGRELGARYILDGSLRQAGGQLRVTIQLVDASTGAQMWAETYERAFEAGAMFDVQDDLVPRVVSTVADMDGVLPQSMAHSLRAKAEEELTVHEALLRSLRYFRTFSPEEQALAKRVLERAVEAAPNRGDCHALLSHLYCTDYWADYDPRPDALDRAHAAARRAVDVAPSNNLSQWALALALFLRRDFPAFRIAAERAIELNPMDGSVTTFIGHLIAYSGDWDRGLAIAAPASALNPHHAGWHGLPAVLDAYRLRDYERALDAALRLDMGGHVHEAALRAATYAQLGRADEARHAMGELLAVVMPDFATKGLAFYRRFLSPELVDHLIEGWRKAGLKLAGTGSGPTQGDEGLGVAVTPFTYGGPEPALESFAEGLTEEINAALSRFSYLRVISRGAGPKAARYVMEGNVRQAGSRLRVTVQLSDTTAGTQLWAETYERTFGPDDIFAIQDDLVPRIVSTAADQYGVLPRSISDVVRGTDPARWSPYEALVHFFGYHQRLTPADHLESRKGLERAVEIAPRNADCWAMLALVYGHEHGHGFNPRPHALERAVNAARRAVDLAPGNHLAHQALSTVLLFRKEIAACLHEADRAIELNLLDGGCKADMGANIAFAGDWDRGCALIERSMELNPNHPVWYRGMLSFKEYLKANYRAAVDVAVKTNAPDLFWMQAVLAAAHGQLGEHEAAATALRALHTLVPDFAANAEAILGTWLQSDSVDHFMKGLRKAGMTEC